MPHKEGIKKGVKKIARALIKQRTFRRNQSRFLVTFTEPNGDLFQEWVTASTHGQASTKAARTIFGRKPDLSGLVVRVRKEGEPRLRRVSEITQRSLDR